MAKKPIRIKRPVRSVKPIAKRRISTESKLLTEAEGLEASTLKVFDVPVGQLVGHDDNPNRQTEQTFDQIVERIRKDGFDEPIHVYPEMKGAEPTGKFKIFSGHHRVKAAKLLGMLKVPAVIRSGWDEDRVKIELISRNNLRGNTDPEKFTKIWSDLTKRYEPEELKKMMGLTEKKALANLLKQTRDALPPKQQKKLDEAKETIKSVDDLSSVLNTIFTQHGSEVDHSFMVFTFGGKKHYYIQIDAHTEKQIANIRKQMGDVEKEGEFFRALLEDQTVIDNVIGKMKRAQTAKKAS